MQKIAILKEHGTNCEFESKFAFELASKRTGIEAVVDIVHMEDLLSAPAKIHDYQTAMLPGGFSYGDDTGSGYRWANRARKVWDEISKFAEGDHLILGVCNGFQALVNLGLLPAVDKKYGERQAALLHNNTARYNDRWVDLKFSGNSPWLAGMDEVSFPIAHGEGRFYSELVEEIKKNGLVAVRYVSGEICREQGLPSNPNGSLDDIAGVIDPSGRILGLMPHPERAVRMTQLPDWTERREYFMRTGRGWPNDGPGLQVFINALNYHERGGKK